MVPTISFKQCTSSLLLSTLLLAQIPVLAGQGTTTPAPVTNPAPETKSSIPSFSINGEKIATAAAIIFTLALLYQHYSADPKEVLEYPEDGSILDVLVYYFRTLAGSGEISPHADSITRIDDDHWKITNCKKKPTGLPGYIYHNYKKIWLPTLGAIAAIAFGIKALSDGINGIAGTAGENGKPGKDAVDGYKSIGKIPDKLKELGENLVSLVA